MAIIKPTAPFKFAKHEARRKRNWSDSSCNSLVKTYVSLNVVYYESLKRALKTKTIYGYRCDERLKTNLEESTRLACTPLGAELEHLKIETRLTSETPVSEMGEYASVM